MITDVNMDIKDIQIQLEKMRQAFLVQLPQRMRMMESELLEIQEAIQEEKSDLLHDLLTQAYRSAHSLTGAGGTFGLQEVTESARELEDVLSHFMQSNTHLDNQDYTAILGQFGKLKTVVTATYESKF